MSSGTVITPSPPSSSTNLTSKDAAVLQALFDAESSSSQSSSHVIIDPSLPSFPGFSESDLASLKERELHAIRQISINNPSPSPETIKATIADLDALISEFPSYPSAYVNRAQALRVLIESQAGTGTGNEDEDDPLFSPRNTRLATQVFYDLGQAITLATPAPASPPLPENSDRIMVSPAQARLLSDAHTHRGYLLLKAAKRKSQQQRTQIRTAGPSQLHHIHSKDELEEMASREFFLAGQYGNEVAKQLAVQTNPYAKMCGAIVREVLRKEVGGDF
jgi:hypothetical protein